MSRTGRDALLEVLRSEGVTHIFGNPGSTELPLIDALAAVGDIEYVLALQEASVIGMADGYARASGRPAVVNLHTSAGVGNAIGGLTNAMANGAPMVVTAGQQDYRHIASDPLLSGDLVGLARATTKWAHEVRTLDELGTVLRRAFHDAMAPPRGPVFVSLPMHILDESGEAPVPAPSRIERGSVAARLDELASIVAATPPDRLAIVVGDEVAQDAAVDAAVELAEAIGCAVYANPLVGSVVFPTNHPLYRGALAPFGAVLSSTLAPFERVLAIGDQLFKTYPYTPGPVVPEHVEILHLASDAHALGRTYAVAFGASGDLRASLEALVPLVRELVDLGAAGERVAAAATAAADGRRKLAEAALLSYDSVPMPPNAMAHALFAGLPDDVTVVDEAITTGGAVRSFHTASRPGQWFFCRGGGLGWGMPAAVGVSLARNREPVVCVVGDGSAMYSPQALWTAAHLDLPVVFAVVNNRQYLILKNFLRRMNGSSVATGRMIGMDLDDPPVDYVALARSMGVEATRVERAAEVTDAAKAAYESGRPHLLELPIAAP
ncbi:MAG TPA: thiamine pyrophosphate-binding protein [Acidimicrobiales bacterium]|jgi:benzoylformate decarboxylase|nr:thiamine pyrophosphate-binding protein [Acidimicrobiales bacterium]